MSYPPNTRHWQVGDLVIHAGDAKKSYMLMKVIGYGKDGLCKTRYANPPHWMTAQHKKRVWVNELAQLLDPVDFKIEVL